MAQKLWGGIFLVIGTSIGAGVLALPIANAAVGFWWSSGLMLLCWCAMTFSALLLLEVNLWLPEGSNLIAMAGATLGRGGQMVTWFAMLLLMYALLAGYIAGGADVLGSLLHPLSTRGPYGVYALVFTGVLGAVVCWGTGAVDHVNRVFMSGKLLVFALLVSCIFPHIQMKPVNSVADQRALLAPLTVIVTSFGYGVVIPSLRTYFESDGKQLRRVVMVGSLIPLIGYFLWNGVIMCVIPTQGKGGLLSMLHSGHAASALVQALDQQLQSQRITQLSHVFTSISMVTSFLGVALALSDFLADGLCVKKSGMAWIKRDSLTFLPPLLMVLFYPGIFMKALNYAGMLCGLLLVLLPCLMAWRGRYSEGIARGWRVKGGKPGLLLGSAVGLLVMVVGAAEAFL